MPSIHFTITAEDKNLQKVLKDIEKGVGVTSRQVEESGASIDDMISKLTKGAAAMGLAFSAKELVSNITKIRGEFQQLEVAFSTMLQSEEKSAKLMAELTELAAVTPFGLQEVANGAKQLLAYGVAAEDMKDRLVMLGDIAAGLSIPFNDLAYLYGTTMTQGRMYTQDLNQFMGRGIPLADELAKQFGVSKEKVKDLVTAGKVGFNEMHKALVAMTSEGGKFGGLMDAQSKTIVGQISNIQDQIDVMFNTIGKSQEGVINTVLSGASVLIENYEKIGKIVLGLASTYGAYRAALIVAAAAEKIKYVSTVGLTTAEKAHYTWLVLVEKAQKMLNKTMLANPYVLATMAVVGLTAGMVKLLNANSGVETSLGRVNRQISEHKSKQDELKEATEKHLAIIQDESTTFAQKQEEYEKLKKLFPQLTGKYSVQALAAMSLADATKAVNKELTNQDILLNKQQIRESQANLKKLNTEKAYYTQRGKDVPTHLEDNIKKEEAVLQELLKTQRKYREAKKIEQEKESIQDKKFWEDKKKDLETKLESLDVSKAGSKEWNDLLKQIDEAQKQIDKYSSSKQAKNDETANELAAKKSAYRLKLEQYKQEMMAEEKAVQLDIRQAEIDAMDEGTDKVLAQIDLDYQRRIDENEKRKQDYIKQIAEQKAEEWEIANPKEVEKGKEFDKSKVTEEDLTPEQKAILEFYDLLAAKEKELAKANATKELLSKYQTYMQKRSEIAEQYEKEKAAMKNEDGTYKKGFSKENEAILEKEYKDALAAVDVEFAMREEQFERWANEVANFSLDALEDMLTKAENELIEMQNQIEEGESAGISDEDLMKARAKVKVLQDAVKSVKVSPEKRAEQDWKKLYETLNDISGQFEEIGSLIGGTGGEIMSLAGTVTSGVLSMINGIKAVAKTGADSLETVEKASVILAIIGTAIKIVTKIINLANELHDKKHENKIQELQEQVDNLDKNYEKLGKEIDKAFSKDASKLIEQQNTLLEQQKRLTQQMINEENQKKKTDDSKIAEWNKELDSINEKIEENKEKAIDAIFGEDLQSAIENFADAYAEALSSSEDGWVSVKDTVKNMMKQMVTESIKSALQSSDAIKKIRTALEQFYADGILTQAEQDAVYKMAEEVQKELDRQFGWSKDLFKDSTSTEQKATYGGFESMSEDTGSELNGRFTALQMAGEEIKTQVIASVMALNALVTSTDTGNSLLGDILTQHAITNAHLEDIVRYAKVVSGYGAKLDKIVEQTKNL